MACQRQLLVCPTRFDLAKSSSELYFIRHTALQFSVSRSFCRTQKRRNHQLRNSPNLSKAISAFKRSKHHSAIATDQAAKKDSLLKIRDKTMGKSSYDIAQRYSSRHGLVKCCDACPLQLDISNHLNYWTLVGFGTFQASDIHFDLQSC